MSNFLGRTFMGRIISLVLLSVLMISCSKERPVQLTDDQKVNLFSKAELEGLQVQAVLENGDVTKQAVRVYEPLKAAEQSQRLKIVEVKNVDNPRIKELLLGQWVEGNPGQVVTLEFGFTKINATVYLTVSKVVKSEEVASLSVLERTQLKGKQVSGGVQKLIVFNYTVATQGQLDRTTNDLGESTRRVWLRKTDIADAEYVQLSSLAEDRQKVGLSALPVIDQRNIFVKENLDDKVYPAKYLKDAMGLKLQLANDQLVMTSLNNDVGGKTVLTVFQILEKSDLDFDSLKILSNNDMTNAKNSMVQHCSEPVAKKALAESGIKDCVIIARYGYDMSYTSILPTVDTFSGQENWASPKLVDEVRPEDALYVKIDITKPAGEVIINHDFNDPSKTLRVKDFVGKEFLFRRTLTDTPNMFDIVFAGLSGDLQVVKFVFNEKTLEIKRSRPLLRKVGVNSVDEEVLMSFDVNYKRQINTSPEGVVLKNPYQIDVKFNHPDAIAFVDWTKNRLPGSGSVLAEWGIEQWCFKGRAGESVEDVNFNKNAGMYGLTIVQSFNGVNGYCASGLSEDYFDGGASPFQQNFTFRERLSFKEYNGESEAVQSYLDIPYETQKRLGFGLFTSYKYTPNKFGNIGYDGTQVSTPAVFDLKDRKSQIVYVLSGIPKASENDELRTMLIKATIEAVADINKAFRKAFKGTPMERPDGLLNEVIRLEIEDMTPEEITQYAGFDVRPTTAGFVGDFDKNYIRYLQKGTKSSIIGLGGAHHNPFSGKVEAASVFIYGGNINSYVEIIRRREAARALYRKNLEKPANIVNIITKEERDLAAAEKLHAVTRTIVDLKNPESLKAVTNAMTAEHLFNALTIGYDPSVLAANVENKSRVIDAISRLKTGVKNNTAINQVMLAGSDHPEIERGKDLYRAYKSLMELSAKDQKNHFVNPRMMEAKLNPTKADGEKFEQLVRKMEDRNYCLHELDAVSSVVFKDGIPDDVTDNDIAVAIYKPTLVHEIGHNLGLRHNFIASFDKANWKFSKDEVTKRDYTSVMDYTPNDHETYDGMGPYDVHALRAAYTGYLELDNNVVNKDGGPTLNVQGLVTKTSDGPVTTSVINGADSAKLISVDDFKKAAGIKSWIDLNTDTLKKVGLRNYMFCSDEDAGQSPTCNRHDLGSTPEEIVDHIIKDYKELYSMYNLRNDKLLFRRWSTGSYVGRLFGQFSTAKMFLEEAIYRLAFLGEDFQTEVMPYFNAAIKAYDFFQEVIRQPDATVEEARAGNRFVKVKVNREELIVEKKAIRDIDHDNVNYFDLAVKGVEFDKVVALMQLTSRDNSSFRYSGRGLVFSYYTLEGWLYNDNLSSSSKVLQILSEMLADEITPATRGSKGLVNLPAKFKVDSTLMMQYYSALAGSLFLDITQGRNNPADMFRVFIGFNPPASRPAIVPPGLGQDDLKYYTTSGSLVSDKLITGAATLLSVANNATLVKTLPQWFVLRKVVDAERAAAASAPAPVADPATASTAAAPAPAPSKNQVLLTQLEAQLKATFKTLPATVPNANVDQLFTKVNSFLNTVASAEKLKDDVSRKDIISDWVDETKAKNLKMAYTDPLFVYTFIGLNSKDFNLTLIDKLKVATSDIDYNLDTRVDSIQYLSQFFYSFNPQYVGQR